MGLRVKITASLLLLALVPLAAATLFLVDVNLKRLTLSAKEFRVAVADEVRLVVMSYLRDAEAELEGIGSLLAQPEVPIAERMRAAKARLLASRRIDNVGVYTKGGQHVETLRVKGAGKAASSPNKLAEKLLAAARERRSAAAALEGKRLPIVAPMYLRGNKQLYGYVRATIAIEPLGAQLRDISERRFDGATDNIYVIDRQLAIVAHGDPRRVGVSLEGKGIASDKAAIRAAFENRLALATSYRDRGLDLLGVLRSVPGIDWAVAVEQEERRAYAGVRTTWVTGLVVGAIFALLAVGLGTLMGRRLSQPVLRLADVAKEVAEGSLDVKIAVERKDEVGVLASSFAKMIDGLREREFIRDTFGRYVTKEVAETILASPEGPRLGGELREVSVLISDLRGFTSLSEHLGPEQMVALLNRYFSRMTTVINENQGTISEFAGDSIVAFFGVPIRREADALRAAACAVAMQLELARFNAEETYPLEMGVGIDSGEVIAGNIGSSERMKYGVVGNTINTAARLESMTVGCQVLISRATLDRIEGKVRVGELIEARAKGKGEPLRCYPLLAVEAGYGLQMPEEEQAMVDVSLSGRFYPIEGKSVAESASACKVLRLGETGLELVTEVPLAVRQNLKLEIAAGDETWDDIYAKVAQRLDEAGSTRATLRFTSVPDRWRSRINRVVAGNAAGT